jgi:hypothetical protein
LVGRFAQVQSKSGDAVKRMLQELQTSRKQNHEPRPQNQFSFNNRRKATGRRHLATDDKLGEANNRVLQERLRRRNSLAPTLIRKFLGLLSVRSMTGARDAAVFVQSAAKDPETTKQKSYRYLTGGGSQPRKADFTRCSGIFRLRGRSSTSKDSLEVAVPGNHVFTPDGAHRIGVDFAGDCQGRAETFLCIKRVIESLYGARRLALPGYWQRFRCDPG